MLRTAGYQAVAAPFGAHFEITSGPGGIEAVRLAPRRPRRREAANFLTRAAAEQLQEYFAGERAAFNLPLAPFAAGAAAHSAYRLRVWRALLDIPYGETRTYAELAAAAGGSARSAGGANGANPLCVLVPCHRVVASGGGLGGYGGPGARGPQRARFLAVKRALLELEAARAALSAPAAG